MDVRGWKNGGKSGEKGKGGAPELKLLEGFISLKCPSLTTEVSLFVKGLPGGFIGQRSATIHHYISFAWSYISETSDKNDIRGSCICQSHSWISRGPRKVSFMP